MKRRFLVGGFVAAVVLFAAGCPESEDSAAKWVKKLDEPKEADHAVSRIEEIGDPSAIEGLGNAWADQGRPVHYLQVIISLARPLTKEEAAAKYLDQYAQAGRPDSWSQALPFLITALGYKKDETANKLDENNQRAVESATKAAEALGESKLEGGLDTLITLASRAPSKKLIQAQVAAIRALGKYDNQKAKATDALQKLVNQDGPDHPRLAKDKDQQRASEEKYGLYLGISGAAINALGELRNPSAAKTLVLSLYRTPELFTQIRRALVATGPSVKDELRSVLRDTNAEVKALFATKKLDKYCGYKRAVECQPVSAKDFYAAVVLGDFYDPGTVPDLLGALKANPPAPVYYEEITDKGEVSDQPSPNSQYNAIFDALRKIGSADAAATIHQMWAGHGAPAAAPPKAGAKKTAETPAAGAGEPDIGTRILAVSAYPFLTRDDTGVEELGAIAADNKADDNLRQEAATAFARLSHNPKDVAILEALADKYFKASADKAKEAAGDPKKKSDAAEEEFKKANEVHKKIADDASKAKSASIQISRDKDAATEAIQAAANKAKEAGDLLKKADEEQKKAKKAHREAQAPYKNLENASKAYKGFARMFQTHIARIEVAIRCKDDMECYANSLKLKPAEAAQHNASYIKDIKDWTDDEKLLLVEAAIERSMLELGKRGQKAVKYTDLLLDNAKSDDRLIRQSILLALPKVAKVPCDNCEAKLEKAIKAGEGKTTIADLNLETTMLRNYFSWAGGKSPGSKPATPDKDEPAEKPDTTPAKTPAKAPPKATTPPPKKHK